MPRFERCVRAFRAMPALAALLLAACQGPPPTDSTVQRADELLKYSRCQEAADTIKPVVEANPGSWGAQYAYGRAMVAFGWVREHSSWVTRVGGAMLVVLGVLLITGLWRSASQSLVGWVSSFAPVV